MKEHGKLSIGHLTASLSDKGSGVKMVVEQLSYQAHVAGLRVKVFGFDEPGFETWHGGPAEQVPLWGPSALGHAPEMRSLLTSFSPEIVHVHGLWLLFGTTALHQKRLHGTPYVISPHGMLANIALKIKPIRKNISRALYQNRLLQNADCLVATSENELNHIRDAGLRGPVAIIPLGIEMADPARHFGNGGDKRVLYIGRKLKLKGLDNLALAWKKVSPIFPEWSLHIVGPDSGGYEAKLLQLIKKEIIPNIEVLPPVFGVDREAAYCGSQFSILPSTTENFALTVGESLMRGVPVISTRATPWAGLQTEACGLWVEGDQSSIAAALNYMMSLTDAERCEMGRRGRNWMRREFQWPVLADKHHQLYNWILGKSDQPDFIATEKTNG